MKIIKLSTDYHCWPLWGVSPNELGNINPNDLPISEELKNKLNEWADIYDSTLNQEYPPNSGFDSKEQEQLFFMEGEALAQELRLELGEDYVVIYATYSRS